MEPLSYEVLQQIVSLSSQGVLLVESSGPDFRIVYANPAYERLSGYKAAELANRAWLSLAAADDDSEDLLQLKRAIACEDCSDAVIPFFRKDGEVWIGRIRLSPVKSPKGGVLMLAQHEAAAGSELQTSPVGTDELLKRALGRARRKIVNMDRTDPGTGLLSRDYFSTLLRRDLAIARRESSSLCLLVFEIVELDVYRQTFGVNAAESCLRMIGAQIAGTFRRAGDLCARFDSASFAVSVCGQDCGEARRQGLRVEEKARSLGLHNPRARAGRYVSVRSVVVEADVAADDVDQLIDRAKVELEEPFPVTKKRSTGS